MLILAALVKIREVGADMSTIQEVQEAEKKVKEVLEALKNSGTHYPDELALELHKSTDEYARVIRELQ